MSARPAIVFIHGVRTSGTIWADQITAVRREGLEAVTVDLPGHGGRIAETFTLPRTHEVIDEAIASFDPATPIVLVGLSLGGYLALAHAPRLGARLAGVVAAGCSTEPLGKPVRAYRDVARVINKSYLAARRTRRAWSWRTSASDGPAHVMAADTVGRPSWQVVTDMLTALSGTSAIASLRAIEAPVWLVNGQHDHLRLEERRYLRARPGTRLIVVRGAGHDVNLDAPLAFNRTLLAVMHNVEARTSQVIDDATMGACPRPRTTTANSPHPLDSPTSSQPAGRLGLNPS